MKKLYQVEPVLESLAKGPILRKVLALALRVLSGVMIVAGLFMILGGIGAAIDVIRTDTTQALGILLSLALLVAGFFLGVKILLFRARSILLCGEEDYPVVQLSAVLLRTGGELLTVFYSAFGLVSGIIFWFGGQFHPLPALPLLFSLVRGGSSFLLGLGIMLASLAQAVLVLVFFYLLAEILLLLRNLALKK